MKFDWRYLTEENYNDMLNGNMDFIGHVHIGDICIELIVDAYGTFIHDKYTTVKLIEFNFYVAHEDTGYGYKDYDIPYDYADGFNMEMPYELSYDEFMAKVENMSIDYIEAYKGNYSLVEHANRPLEIW